MKYHTPTFSFQGIKISRNSKVFQRILSNKFNKCYVYLKLPISPSLWHPIKETVIGFLNKFEILLFYCTIITHSTEYFPHFTIKFNDVL